MLEQGIDVRGYSRSPQPDQRFLPYAWRPLPGKFVFTQVDLNHQLGDLVRDLCSYRPKVIVNFASQCMVNESWQYPEQWMQTNVVALTSLVRAMAGCDFLERYIHFTTPEVYGPTAGWVKESFDFKPSTPYAASRAAGDWVVKMWLDQYGLPAIFTRAANIYGEGQQLYRIIPKTLLFAMRSRKIPLHGGGTSVRSFVHMDDVSDALLRIIAAGTIGASYHISPDESVSIRVLVEMIGSLANVPPDRLYEIVGDRLGKDQAYLLDAGFIRDSLGWAPAISLAEGLERCYQWVSLNQQDFSASDATSYIHKA
jgi:dTDP-glucose 4,6-dehydratase